MSSRNVRVPLAFPEIAAFLVYVDSQVEKYRKRKGKGSDEVLLFLLSLQKKLREASKRCNA